MQKRMFFFKDSAKVEEQGRPAYMLSLVEFFPVCVKNMVANEI